VVLLPGSSRRAETVDIIETGWNAYREGVPVLPGTLLYRHRRCLRPERVTPHSERSRKSFSSLMQEGGRIELHRVSPRLTACKAVSTPNGLHLPRQRADALRRHRLTRGWRRGPDLNWRWRDASALPYHLGYPVSSRPTSNNGSALLNNCK
jgi:hypothetical protein